MGKKENARCVHHHHHHHATKIVTVTASHVGIVGITSHAATRDNAPLIMENVHRDQNVPKIVTVVDITCAA